jgi:hypothetical protein
MAKSESDYKDIGHKKKQNKRLDSLGVSEVGEVLLDTGYVGRGCTIAVLGNVTLSGRERRQQARRLYL